MQSTSSETELLERLAVPRLRDQAFRELVATYGPALHGHLLRMLRSETDVDDVLQNTFIKVYRGLDGFREQSKLSTWLYRIATNEALTWLRSAKRRGQRTVSQSNEQLAVHHPRADTPFDGEAAQQQLLLALDRLPPKQRAVFSMRYFDELTYAEIGRITGTSVGGLKASYHLAAKKIEQQLLHYAAQ